MSLHPQRVGTLDRDVLLALHRTAGAATIHRLAADLKHTTKACYKAVARLTQAELIKLRPEPDAAYISRRYVLTAAGQRTAELLAANSPQIEVLGRASGPRGPSRHVLLAIDTGARSGTCACCGPVDLVWLNTAKRWRCGVAYRDGRRDPNPLGRRKLGDKCPSGHDMNPANTMVRVDGGVRCRDCHNAKKRERRARRAGDSAPSTTPP